MGTKKLIAMIVMGDFGIGGMGLAIDFDDQPRLAAGKIGNVGAERMLFAKMKPASRVTPQA
ncbi:MAG: hypothetical protein P4L57_15150 [Rhizomicrobium sp.]|nr:hypothetical protein [Rhizomicrobium sp.]